MTNIKLKPLVLAMAAALVLTPVAQAATQPAPQIREDISTSPGRTISPADEQMLSTVANKVLHRVAQARDALRAKDMDKAKAELAKADTLMDIIQSTAPTTVVKDQIWTADNKLKYENTEVVSPSSIPIYANLGEDDLYTPSRGMDKAQPAKATAGKGAPASVKNGKPGDIEDRFDVVYYEEMDLPVNMTRHFISLAREEMAKNQLSQAADTLQSALDNVDFVSVYLPEPLMAAVTNLERADDHYKSGAIPEAKADIHTAIAQLTRAEKDADAGSKADVQKLLQDATTLQGRIDRSEPNLGDAFKQVWHRTEALADRAMESTSVGWARLRVGHDTIRKDLIEAKRYVAYADIDANIAREPARAKTDLVKAQDYLGQAEKAAADKPDAMVYVKDAKAVVDSLLAGQAGTDHSELHNLKAQLGQAIGNV